ncbi:MAG: DMT family transporter [Verrucomicrobia bacterium]|nr:DMT family transporter [Verrucomicrobiota bacterium]
MLTGILFALAACFIWGLIFVIPGFMDGFSSLEVALGRFTFYGILSMLIFLRAKTVGRCRYPLRIWLYAFYLSFFLTIGCYVFLVLGLRYSTPAICALVLGISPITIGLLGSWKEKEIPFKNLLLPSILIVIGMTIINLAQFGEGKSSFLMLGLVCAFISLVSWNWYVVVNSRFLKDHPDVEPSEWTTLIGVATLVWVVLIALILALFFKDQFSIEKYCTPSLELRNFLIGSAVLGLFCSWVATSLWNRATLYLPVSFAGQLTIFETVFGIMFFYLIKGHPPSWIEGLGIIILLSAVVYGIRKFKFAASS